MPKPILIPCFAPESLLIFNSNATTPCHRAEGDPALQWRLSSSQLSHCRVQRSTDWRLRPKVSVTTASTAVTRRVPPLAVQRSTFTPGRGEQASIRYHDKREYGFRSRAMGLPWAFLRIERDQDDSYPVAAEVRYWCRTCGSRRGWGVEEAEHVQCGYGLLS